MNPDQRGFGAGISGLATDEHGLTRMGSRAKAAFMADFGLIRVNPCFMPWLRIILTSSRSGLS